jgi:hypothetical protein
MQRNASKPGREPRPRFRERFDDPEIGDGGTARKHAADESGSHVAAADERRCHG